MYSRAPEKSGLGTVLNPGFEATVQQLFEREQMLTRIRKEADAAWTAKEFPRVAELLEPVRADLTEVESKRLAYAEKQVRAAVHEESTKRG